MRWGRQLRYCPNCGKQLYDDKLSGTHVKSLMCSTECLHEWELKYARKLLGKDGPTQELSLIGQVSNG